MKAFDPYHEWLGIPPKDQPAHFYRLLGLELFESDPKVIESCADRQRAYVKQYQTGSHSAESQRLLSELSRAAVCLLNAAEKSKYDESLRQLLQPSQFTPSFAPMLPEPVLVHAPYLPEPVAEMAETIVRPTVKSPRIKTAKAKAANQLTMTLLFVGLGIAAVGLVVVAWMASEEETKRPPPKPQVKKTDVPTLPIRGTMPPLPPKPVVKEVSPLIEAKLAEAKAANERSQKLLAQVITADFEKRLQSARNENDSKLVEELTAQQQAYQKQSIVSAKLPEAELEKVLSSRAAVVAAYDMSIRAHREADQGLKAISLEQERNDFLASESAVIGDVVKRYPESWFRVVNVNSGLALGIEGAIAQRDLPFDDPTTQWQFVPTNPPNPDGFYFIKNRQSGLVVNIPASDRRVGTQLIQFRAEGTWNSFWTAEYNGAFYYFRSRHSGHFIAVAEGKRSDRAGVIQWNLTGGEEQKWNLVRVVETGS